MRRGGGGKESGGEGKGDGVREWWERGSIFVAFGGSEGSVLGRKQEKNNRDR